MTTATASSSRSRLLEAGSTVIRAKGYTATTVDDICAAAGVTKGSFFHHFKTKEELVLGAVAHWNEWTETVFAAADYHRHDDPLQRLLGYVDLRISILDRGIPEFTCLLGTLVQETYATHPAVREACDRGMSSHIVAITRDAEAARQLYAPNAEWTAESVGYFIQAVLQGSFIFAKAKQQADVARQNLAHLRRYLVSLFPASPSPRR
ncbi:MAG: TetR/AcrR family transcriptional regulator [Alphaproteobacteria bacterium]|nr:TetR/AcrR family transcriptional regulator [Alphaproteobacteria bacterium]MCW5739596.1 TetR/AcrR family transcriptional regulator [Alphaproteobacteria bacterium]